MRIVDVHLHVDDVRAFGWRLEADECIRRMDEAGIERGVVMTIVDAPEVNPRRLSAASAHWRLPGSSFTPGRRRSRWPTRGWRAVVEVARAHQVPVVVASGYPWVSESLQVGELAGRFPDVTFVATNGLQINMSGLGQTDAEFALADNENILVQTTGVYREDFIERVVSRHGAERVLYASALPNFDPRLERRRVQWARFSAVEIDAIVDGNADRLFFRGAP